MKWCLLSLAPIDIIQKNSYLFFCSNNLCSVVVRLIALFFKSGFSSIWAKACWPTVPLIERPNSWFRSVVFSSSLSSEWPIKSEAIQCEYITYHRIGHWLDIVYLPPTGNFVDDIFLKAQWILQHISPLTMAVLSCNTLLYTLPYKRFDN